MHKRQSLSRSFRSAFRGVGHALRERNFKIQVAIGVLAVVFSFVLGVTPLEQFIVIILIALVLAAEMFNSALERLLDVAAKEENPEIAEAKELFAGAVLVFAVAAVVIGLWIFGGRLF